MLRARRSEVPPLRSGARRASSRSTVATTTTRTVGGVKKLKKLSTASVLVSGLVSGLAPFLGLRLST